MRNYQRGQILLIVVLVMTIVLTVGLSIASRTISDLRTGSEQESSQRAFSAAEAGIEKTLQESNGASGTFSNNASFQTSIATVSGVEVFLNDGVTVLKDNVADLWLSQYPGYLNPWSGTVTIYWGNSSDTCTPEETTNTMAALEIVAIEGTKAFPTLTHYPVDPCPARAAVNQFESIPPGGRTFLGQAFAFKKTLTVNSGMLIRIAPLYAPTAIGVRGCDGFGNNCQALPAQGKLVTSVGTSQNTQRKLVGFQEYPKLPMQIFPYILFSTK